MPEVKLDAVGIPGATPSPPNIIKETSGYLGDIIKLVANGEKLLGHISNIVIAVKGGQGAGNSNIIDSGPPNTQKNVQNNTNKAPEGQTEAPSDKAMSDFVMSPEGLKKIAGAIDKLIPVMGDVKLSEFRKALIGESKGEQEKTENSESKGEKKNGTQKSKK